MVNIINACDDINVKLIGSLNRESFVDIAGAVTRSEKKLDDIISMNYDPELVEKIVGMNHLATTEFDYFVFAVEGLSRACEAQLVRKRHAAFMIKSGRVDKKGKRSFDVVKPNTLDGMYSSIKLNPSKILLNDSCNLGREIGHDANLVIDLTFDDLMDIISQWYEHGVKQGFKEEDLRYAKPQGTEFKGLIAMNAHALLDWFKIRCCLNAQDEINSLATKMCLLAKKKSPSLFKKAGASCVCLGYCPENEYQNRKCAGKIPTHKDVLKLLSKDKSWKEF